jgi:hypothetical protein
MVLMCGMPTAVDHVYGVAGFANVTEDANERRAARPNRRITVGLVTQKWGRILQRRMSVSRATRAASKNETVSHLEFLDVELDLGSKLNLRHQGRIR